ncbi:unnamed protein product [Choristocarpus tenellus]
MGCNLSSVDYDDKPKRVVRTATCSFEDDQLDDDTVVALVETEEESLRERAKFHSNISLSSLQDIQPLASGGFCAVYSCNFGGHEAVLKTPRRDCSDPMGAIADIEREIATYMRIMDSTGGHARICKAYGAGCYQDKGVDRPFLVLERLRDDTLAHALESTGELGGPSQLSSRCACACPPMVLLEQRLEICLELVQALEYLHNSAIPGCCVLHRDLKPTNIGLTVDGHIKVFDLGLSTVLDTRQEDDEKFEMTGETGSKRFMAPEVCRGLPYNEKADVYSFSIIMWEMCALLKPFAQMDAEEHFREVIEKGTRPPLSDAWPVDVILLMEDCWNEDPDCRPVARVVRERLENIVRNSKEVLE